MYSNVPVGCSPVCHTYLLHFINDLRQLMRINVHANATTTQCQCLMTRKLLARILWMLPARRHFIFIHPNGFHSLIAIGEWEEWHRQLHVCRLQSRWIRRQAKNRTSIGAIYSINFHLLAVDTMCVCVRPSPVLCILKDFYFVTGRLIMPMGEKQTVTFDEIIFFELWME